MSDSNCTCAKCQLQIDMLYIVSGGNEWHLTQYFMRVSFLIAISYPRNIFIPTVIATKIQKMHDQDPEVYPFQDWGSPTGKDYRAVPPSLRSHDHGRHRPFQSHGTLQRPSRRSDVSFWVAGKTPTSTYHWSFMTCSTQVSNRIFAG